MRDQTQRIKPAVSRILTAYASGAITHHEAVEMLVNAFDYLVGEIEDIANKLHEMGIALPTGWELKLITEKDTNE